MIEGRCHCGRISWQLRAEPEWLTRCNCSYCRRSAALWAHADMADITIAGAGDGDVRYVQGDGTLAFVSCGRCGCTTHWESTDPAAGSRMAVNMNMADPQALEGRRIRHFDGAESWTFLD